MPKRTKWVGVILFVLAFVIGASYVWASVGHRVPPAISATTMSISPEELTLTAGRLPALEVETYF